MIKQYRHKPGMIKATQWFPSTEIPGIRLVEATSITPAFGRIDNGGYVYIGDYVTVDDTGKAKGVMRPDYFREHYELA